ncbi:hypothetical protein X741_15620 [Mesorhizobium sp. LNHC229A00]|nr:hypothetical protein X741_15620 [Mesorhizobium sp. LNHC229A00]
MWRRRPAVDQRDLLPDLARQVGRQVLDVVDAGYDDSVIDGLGEQRRDLAGDRQHFGAIVEIARKIRGIG